MKSTTDVNSSVGADAAEALWIYVTQVNYSLKNKLVDNWGRCCIDVTPLLSHLLGCLVSSNRYCLFVLFTTSKMRITSPFSFKYLLFTHR